jgi:hypothetical protein
MFGFFALLVRLHDKNKLRNHMAWLPMYMIREDIAILNHLLNQEIELAFLVGNGFGKWIARASHDMGEELTNRNHWQYALWHVPSGPLPIIEPGRDHTKGILFGEVVVPLTIPNPWEGWDQLRTVTPSFGNATSTGVFQLDISFLQRDSIPISHFGWIGNHYREIGYPAHPATSIFWLKLKRLIKKHTVYIPRANNPALKNEIYAFPEAYKAIQGGHLCHS